MCYPPRYISLQLHIKQQQKSTILQVQNQYAKRLFHPQVSHVAYIGVKYSMDPKSAQYKPKKIMNPVCRTE